MKAAGYIFRYGNWRYYLLLIAVAILAYWPLSFHIFSLKNDALSYFLPLRYHVSTAIREGYFPYWSPYLYTGLPLHADIQSGVWNPVVMLLSLFTVYDMSVLQSETFFYIALGGIGFFKLCRVFGLEQRIAFALAVSYQCSGFVIDSGAFIPWISSAAYLPFVLGYYIRLMRNPSFNGTLKLALSHALLFLAGYLSFFIVATYLLVFIGLGQLIYLLRRHKKREAWMLLRHVFFAGFIAALICLPALLSYIQFLPYYARGSGASLEAAQLNPFRWGNTVSYLLPPASYLLDKGNDVSARNAFIGLVPLLFLIYAFRFRFTMLQKTIAFATLILFLFSLGRATPVRAFFYHVLPLMDSFRHPATIRLFTTAGLLLLSGFGWQRFDQKEDRKLLQKIVIGMMVTIVTIIVVSALLNAWTLPRWNGWSAAGIKQWMEKASFTTWAILAGSVQLFFLVVLLVKPFGKSILATSVINLFVMTTLAMPFTTVSQHSVGEVNDFVHSRSSGYPADKAWLPVQDNINDASRLTPMGYTAFYSKQIEIQDHIITPTVNTAYGDLLRDTALRREIGQHRFAYLKNSGNLSLTRFTPNAFSFSITTAAPDTVYITQQYNPNWQATVNGQSTTITRRVAFMQLAVPAGRSEVELSYRAPLIEVTAIIAVIVLAASLILALYWTWKD